MIHYSRMSFVAASDTASPTYNSKHATTMHSQETLEIQVFVRWQIWKKCFGVESLTSRQNTD
jgi:hypothetical protein